MLGPFSIRRRRREDRSLYFGILSAQQFITSQHTYTTTTILVPHISTKSQQPDLLVFRAVGEEEREREEWEWEWERLGIRGRHVPEPEYWLIQVILRNYKGVFKAERWIFIHIVTFLDNVPLFLHCPPWPLVSRVAVHSQRLNNCQLEIIITVASALTCTCAGSRSS